MPNAVTRRPQSGERITGAMSCIRVHKSYPGGPPNYRVNRITGAGEVWTAELLSDYGTERWFALSVIELCGTRIARMTDYFGQAFQAPEWRKEMVSSSPHRPDRRPRPIPMRASGYRWRTILPEGRQLMPEQLEIVAHGVTAILATWLGLIVLTRSAHRRGARLFALLTLYLVAWSVAIVVQRLTSQPATVVGPLNAIEDVAAFMLPVTTLNIALVLAVEGPWSRTQQVVLVAAYVLSIAMALGAVFFPEQQLRVSSPHLVLPGVSGEVLGWSWIAARILILVAAIYWVSRALERARGDEARWRQLVALLATVVIERSAACCDSSRPRRTTPRGSGVTFITLGVVVAAYAVFAQGVFLSSEVAGRAFRYSLAVGVGVTLYVTS